MPYVSEDTLPKECLLCQAARWVSFPLNGEPIPISDYFALPDDSQHLGEGTRDGQETLFLALRNGKLSARGVWSVSDNSCDIPKHLWDWKNISWRLSELEVDEFVSMEGVVRQESGVFFAITIRSIDILETLNVNPFGFRRDNRLAKLAASKLADPPTHPPVPTSTRKGRPAKYQWEEFFGHVAVIADLDGLPDTKAELERTMADWCLDQWGTIPSESVIRAKLTPIFDHPRKRGKGR